MLLAVSYQLQSCLSRDLLQYADAHRAYQQAAQIVRGLDDAELLAAAMARDDVTLLQEGRPGDAIIMLQGALDTIKHAGLPALRGYLLQALSEAYASVAEPQACWRAIGLAERVLEREDVLLETSTVRFSAASVIAQKGVDAVLLRDDDRAVALIDKSLATYDPTQVRGRARLLAQKAEAYSRLGHLDACVATAEEALTLANAVGSAKTVARVERLHATLEGSRWRREPAVHRLGALLSL
jgi:tetratricopeptide (TPR) repeat protein